MIQKPGHLFFQGQVDGHGRSNFEPVDGIRAVGDKGPVALFTVFERQFGPFPLGYIATDRLDFDQITAAIEDAAIDPFLPDGLAIGSRGAMIASDRRAIRSQAGYGFLGLGERGA